jgi:hypothetical protein
VIAVTAAVIAGSVALLGFGIDSFVECSSALVMLWLARAKRRVARELGSEAWSGKACC